MKYEVDTYTLEYIESENKYYISFKDSVGTNCRIEISKTIFNEYLKSRKSYIKIKNETSRHIEHKSLTDEELYKRVLNKNNLSAEDKVIEKIEMNNLNNALKKLTDLQNRRIELHIVNNITIADISKLEKVERQQVYKSIKQGLKKIKKFLKNRDTK